MKKLEIGTVVEKPKLRILFNGSHSDIPWKKNIPQGGPSTFIRIFSQYFKKQTGVELISLLFSHNERGNEMYIRERRFETKYYELVYPRDSLINSYKKERTLHAYKIFLTPWLNKIDEILVKAKPDVVFLNGFNLSNWMLMEAAYKKNIPVCVQHAGIWKKELEVSQLHFNKKIKKIFIALEKEIFTKASHQIFLNNFSQKIFYKIHNFKKTSRKLPISIVPLPLNWQQKIIRPVLKKKKVYSIGVVARWDNIKNHSLILKLTDYIRDNHLDFRINVITKIPTNVVSNFKDMYKKSVNVLVPRDFSKLNKFYQSQDMILIPSHFDVSPTVFMEAMLNGKPVLISKNTGWVQYMNKFDLKRMVFNSKTKPSHIFEILNHLILKKNDLLLNYEKMQKDLIKKHDVHRVMNEYLKIFTNLKV